MPPFSAQLRVASHVFPVQQCHYHISQATDGRGRVATKVRYGSVELWLDVPDNDFLLAWAAGPRKQLAADIIILDPTSGIAKESLRLATAYCVGYHENFTAGDTAAGAYQCVLTLSDPAGFSLHVGAPGAAFATPAPGTHRGPLTLTGTPAPPVPGVSGSDCSPAVTALLQKQVELMCKPKGTPSKCFDTDDCSLLLQKISMTEACIEARCTINNQCFKGGDVGHQQAILERQNGIRKCEAIYLRKCGSKPQPVPVPSTDTSPSKKPDDSKYGPTTLVGAALIIYIILTAPFRTVPN